MGGGRQKFGPGKAYKDSSVNLCPLTHFHPHLPYMSLDLEEAIGRAPGGTFGDLETVLALRSTYHVAVGKTF